MHFPEKAGFITTLPALWGGIKEQTGILFCPGGFVSHKEKRYACLFSN